MGEPPADAMLSNVDRRATVHVRNARCVVLDRCQRLSSIALIPILRRRPRLAPILAMYSPPITSCVALNCYVVSIKSRRRRSSSHNASPRRRRRVRPRVPDAPQPIAASAAPDSPMHRALVRGQRMSHRRRRCRRRRRRNRRRNLRPGNTT